MDSSGFNSALSVPNVQSLQDWYSSQSGENGQFYGLGADFSNWINGWRDRAKDEYSNYLALKDKEWELAKINDARRWEEYMSNTAFSRQMKDIENAGYNPLLALTGGSGSGAPVMASPTGNSSTSFRDYQSGRKNSMDDIGKLLSSALTFAGMYMMMSGRIASASIIASSRIPKY